MRLLTPLRPWRTDPNSPWLHLACSEFDTVQYSTILKPAMACKVFYEYYAYLTISFAFLIESNLCFGWHFCITKPTARHNTTRHNATHSLTHPPTSSRIYDDNTAYKLTLTALECGYRNFFASVLAGNQKGFAKAIKDSNVPREDLYICGSVVSNRASGFESAKQATTKGAYVRTMWMDCMHMSMRRKTKQFLVQQFNYHVEKTRLFVCFFLVISWDSQVWILENGMIFSSFYFSSWNVFFVDALDRHVIYRDNAIDLFSLKAGNGIWKHSVSVE